MARIPMSLDLIYDEIKSAKKVLEKWEKSLADGQVPGVDLPGGDQQLIDYMSELCGELQVVSNKCHGLAIILAENVA